MSKNEEPEEYGLSRRTLSLCQVHKEGCEQNSGSTVGKRGETETTDGQTERHTHKTRLR